MDVFGTRDAGLAKAITAVRVSNKGGTSTYQFDDLGRPTRANVPNGALFSFKWTSPTEALVTAVTPDGTNLLKTVVTLPAQSKAARARTALARADLVGEGEVKIRSCGNVPEDFAEVTITRTTAAIAGGVSTSFPASLTGEGSGLFKYALPIPNGADKSPLSLLKTDAAVFDNLCLALDPTQEKIESAPGKLLAAAVCTGLAGLGGSVTGGAAFLPLLDICGQLFEGLGGACLVRDLIDKADDFVDTSVNAPVTLKAEARRIGDAAPVSQTIQDVPAVPDGGRFPFFDLELPCVRSGNTIVSIFGAASVKQGAFTPLTASASDDVSHKVIIDAEFDWSIADTSIATVQPVFGVVHGGTSKTTTEITNVIATMTSPQMTPRPIGTWEMEVWRSCGDQKLPLQHVCCTDAEAVISGVPSTGLICPGPAGGGTRCVPPEKNPVCKEGVDACCSDGLFSTFCCGS